MAHLVERQPLEGQAQVGVQGGREARLLQDGLELVVEVVGGLWTASLALLADAAQMATDVDGVYVGWGTPEQRRLERVTPAELRATSFPAGSMMLVRRPRPS